MIMGISWDITTMNILVYVQLGLDFIEMIPISQNITSLSMVKWKKKAGTAPQSRENEVSVMK